MSFAGKIEKGFKGWLGVSIGYWVGLKSARVSIIAGGQLRTAIVNRSSLVWEYGGVLVKILVCVLLLGFEVWVVLVWE